MTVASAPAVARRVVLDRRACEAAGHVCVVEGLAAGRSFIIKVRAINALGKGSWSAPTLPVAVRAAASLARLGDAWGDTDEAAVAAVPPRPGTSRPTTVRLETPLGASFLPAGELAATAQRRALLSARSSGDGGGGSSSKRLTKEQQAAADAAEAAAIAAAIAAATAAAKAAAAPRLLGRGVLASPARPPGSKPAAPPKPPRERLVPVIYKVTPDFRADEETGEEEEEEEEEVEEGGADGGGSGGGGVQAGEGAAGDATSAAAVTAAPVGEGGTVTKQSAAASKARTRSPAKSSVAAAARPRTKKAPQKSLTLGGVRQPRRYFAPAYYEDPYARAVGESMLRDEAAERERLIALAREAGDTEALALAEAEAAAAAAAEAEAEAQEAAEAEAEREDPDLRDAASRSVRFVEAPAPPPAAAPPQPPPSLATKRKAKLHDSSLSSFLTSAAAQSKARRASLDLHLDLGALARLPGVLRDYYDPALSGPGASADSLAAQMARGFARAWARHCGMPDSAAASAAAAAAACGAGEGGEGRGSAARGAASASTASSTSRAPAAIYAMGLVDGCRVVGFEPSDLPARTEL